jgi:hypothetical protein
VRVVEGDYNVLPPGSAELSLIGTAHFVDRRRLSCQLKCFGDITVDLSEQIKKEQKALAKNSRSRAGADELSISRAEVVAESASAEGGPDRNQDVLREHDADRGEGSPGEDAGEGAGGVGRESAAARTRPRAHDASGEELREIGDGLGPDDYGGDDLEGEREVAARAVGPRPQPGPGQGSLAAEPQGFGRGPARGLPSDEPGGQKRRRRRGRRGGGGGGGAGGGSADGGPRGRPPSGGRGPAGSAGRGR